MMRNAVIGSDTSKYSLNVSFRSDTLVFMLNKPVKKLNGMKTVANQVSLDTSLLS